jgi:hypothetical protein
MTEDQKWWQYTGFVKESTTNKSEIISNSTTPLKSASIEQKEEEEPAWLRLRKYSGFE